MKRTQNRGSPMGRRCFISGFTLIELLVVIGIIALLVAILLPALQRAMAEARKASCASNMRQWATAVNAYAGDWDGRFPQRYEPAHTAYTLQGHTMMVFARDYLGVQLPDHSFGEETEAGVLHCPTVDRYRAFGLRRPSWSPDRKYIYHGYWYWPNVRYTSSSLDYYVHLLWITRERMNTRAREAPILSDVYHTEIPDGDPFTDLGDPGRPDWNAHRDLSPTDDHPGGINGAHEDGSVRWTEAEDVMPGFTRETGHSTDGVWRFNVPYSGLEVYPDGNAYEDRPR